MPIPEKKISAKEALLEVAKELFAERGYDSVSTREIADRAGVNLAAIQYHFGSKANLFAEVGKNFMQGSNCAESATILADQPVTPHEAAVKICRFVESILRELLKRDGPQPCRLMFREVFAKSSEDSELFEVVCSSVVEHFFRPLDENLLIVLGVLKPTLDIQSRQLAAQSIVGQCTYYLTHGPFVERLRKWDLNQEALLITLAQHICKFSFNGLGCDEAVISSAFKAVWGSSQRASHKQIREKVRRA